LTDGKFCFILKKLKNQFSKASQILNADCFPNCDRMLLNPKIQHMVPNLNYAQELNPFSSLSTISAIGLELWSITEDIYFDNFLITNREQVGLDLAKQIFEFRNRLEYKKPVRNAFF